MGVNKHSPGCLCCGDPSNEISAGDCCHGVYLENATVTNLLITNTATSETWTQDGASSWKPFGNWCRFNVPTNSSVDGPDTIRVTYTNSTIDEPDFLGGWSITGITDVAQFILGDAEWIAGDASVSFTDGDYTVYFDISGVVSCGCCGECPYEVTAITNLSFTWDGDLHTQSSESRFEDNLGYGEYCGWRMMTTGGTWGDWIIRRNNDTFVLVEANFRTDEGSGTMSGCAGTVTFTSFGLFLTSGSFTLTSSGNCPDEL